MWNKTVYEFGQVEFGQSYLATFEWQGEGIITSVTKSCSCADVTWDSNVVKATVRMDTAKGTTKTAVVAAIINGVTHNLTIKGQIV